ncbi:MAG TPA: hypothetical protein VHA30_01735 [Patescibacteria group bacterium]|nr:hypothetical protein [Patescibacteria group bacterium]
MKVCYNALARAMLSYKEIKIKIQENKPKIILGICFILVFLIGFGSGKYEKQIQRQTAKSQNNYSTKKAVSPSPAVERDKAAAAAPAVEPAAVATSTPAVAGAAATCLIKGNISSSGRKLYHVVGGAFYNTVKPEQCFNTEAEALAAGFTKSSR